MISKWVRGLLLSVFYAFGFSLAPFDVALFKRNCNTKANLCGRFFRIRLNIITFEGFFGGFKTAKSSNTIY